MSFTNTSCGLDKTPQKNKKRIPDGLQSGSATKITGKEQMSFNQKSPTVMQGKDENATSQANNGKWYLFGSQNNTGTFSFGQKPMFDSNSGSQKSNFSASNTYSFGKDHLNKNEQDTKTSCPESKPGEEEEIPPYKPFISHEKDSNGISTTAYQYNTITCLPEYRHISVEELRLRNYQEAHGKAIISATANEQVKEKESANDNQNKSTSPCNRAKVGHLGTIDPKAEKDTTLTEKTETDSKSTEASCGVQAGDNDDDPFAKTSLECTRAENAASVQHHKIHTYIEDVVKDMVKKEVLLMFEEGQLDKIMEETIKDELCILLGKGAKNVTK